MIPNHDSLLLKGINDALDAQDKYEHETEMINGRAAELLAGYFSPTEPDNISEAMGDIDLYDIGQLMKAGYSKLLGDAVISGVKAYWTKRAYNQACEELKLKFYDI